MRSGVVPVHSCRLGARMKRDSTGPAASERAERCPAICSKAWHCLCGRARSGVAGFSNFIVRAILPGLGGSSLLGVSGLSLNSIWVVIAVFAGRGRRCSIPRSARAEPGSSGHRLRCFPAVEELLWRLVVPGCPSTVASWDCSWRYLAGVIRVDRMCSWSETKPGCADHLAPLHFSLVAWRRSSAGRQRSVSAGYRALASVSAIALFCGVNCC